MKKGSSFSLSALQGGSDWKQNRDYLISLSFLLAGREEKNTQKKEEGKRRKE